MPRVWKFGADVDTDQIVPGRYAPYMRPGEEPGQFAFIEARPDFAQGAQPGDVIVAGPNFGCGSSREYAPAALKTRGVGAIIAPSFARIFFRNAINLGIPLYVSERIAAQVSDGEEVTLDLAGNELRTARGAFPLPPSPPLPRRSSRRGASWPTCASTALFRANRPCRSQSMPILCVIEGDGVGREVIPAAVRVLQALLPQIELVRAEAGWGCFERSGTAVPEETVRAILSCGAALFGAVASPSRPVAGYRSAIVTLRQALTLHANVRPTRSLPLPGARAGVDVLVVRENTEGLYSGRERLEAGGAVAERVITRAASARVARTALALAQAGGRRRVTIVHKANILPLTDGLFRDTVREVAADFPAIQVDEMLVDTAAMWLAQEPERFDTIVTTNLFGDILSDVASVWGGGMGLAPSLNLGTGVALAEPVHGAAPDIAGKGIANPIAAILSVALLLRYHWSLGKMADRVEQAVWQVLADGYHTPDLVGPASHLVGTAEMTDAILHVL